jgi:hypothetical protein
VNLKHFLHIGKTGGTAIKAALEPLAGQFGLIFHRHSMRASDLPPDDDFFFCVRDPVSRYVSAFNSRYRQGQPRYLVPWRAGEQCAFERFSSANALAESINSDNEEQRRHARHAMRTIQHVCSHQHQWFANWQMAARAIWIGFTDTLSADFEVLKEKLGLPESLALPMDSKSAHRACDELPKHLTQRARTNLEWWYQEDIRFVDFLRRLRSDGNY